MQNHCKNVKGLRCKCIEKNQKSVNEGWRNGRTNRRDTHQSEKVWEKPDYKEMRESMEREQLNKN